MFDYIISLGNSCAVASSMAKYGFRSFSGPFDWLHTFDFSKVLHCMETDFVDFLQQENLEPRNNEDGYVKIFQDKKSGFVFIHEKEDYRYEYDSLRQKYDRRTARFNLLTQKKICFLRYVTGQQEVDYILNHAQYIQNVIRKNNKDNQILFLVNDNIKMKEPLPFPVYKIEADNRLSDKADPEIGRLQIRSWFDNSLDLLAYLGQNYPGGSIIKNLSVEQESELVVYLRRKEVDKILADIKSQDFSKAALYPKVMIYGAGKLGRTLYGKIQNFTQVECFVDRSKGGTRFQEVPVLSVHDLRNPSECPIIVSTTYDFEAIKQCLCEKYGDITVLSLYDICDRI